MVQQRYQPCMPLAQLGSWWISARHRRLSSASLLQAGKGTLLQVKRTR